MTDTVLSAKLSVLTGYRISVKDGMLSRTHGSGIAKLSPSEVGLRGISPSCSVYFADFESEFFLMLDDTNVKAISDTVIWGDLGFTMDLTHVKNLDLCVEICSLGDEFTDIRKRSVIPRWSFYDNDMGRSQYLYLLTGCSLIRGMEHSKRLDVDWEARYMRDSGYALISRIDKLTANNVFDGEYGVAVRDWREKHPKNALHDMDDYLEAFLSLYYSDLTDLSDIEQFNRYLCVICGQNEEMLACLRRFINRLLED